MTEGLLSLTIGVEDSRKREWASNASPGNWNYCIDKVTPYRFKPYGQ